MLQQTFSSQGSFEKYGRKSRRELFLDEMERVVPWGELQSLIAPHYAKAGNGRVRRGMLQLAWRWLMFQRQSALTRWYRARTADGRKDTRKTMIVALARKLLIALWRYVTAGELPEGVVLKAA